MKQYLHALQLRLSRKYLALFALVFLSTCAADAVTNPLDLGTDLAPLTLQGYLNGTISFSESGGTGTPATGGITMFDSAPTGTEHTGIVFANSSLNAATNGVFTTSLMVNFRDFFHTDGVKDKGEVRIGFTTSTTVNASKAKEFLNKTNPCFGVKLSGEHQHGTTDRKMEIEVVSYTTAEEKPAALKKTVTGASYFSNWLRLTFTATKTGTSTFSISVVVEDCGADGTAMPGAIAALGAGPGTVTNATFSADTSVFATFLIAPDKTIGTTTYVDNYTYDVILPPPGAPTAGAATSVAASAFTTNWQAGTGVPPTSYVLEMTTAANNFAPNTFIASNGAGGQAGGVTTSAASQAFANLSPLTSYVYRVRAVNTAGSSANSNIITITTIDGNSAPTLDAIPSQVPVRPTDGAKTITLTGISAGGESGQTVTLSAVSSNPAILPHPLINYTSPAATATLTYDPNNAGSGDVTITVTANDGQAENNAIVRTFVVPVQFPAPQLSFENDGELAHLFSQTVNVTIGRADGIGIGSPAGGGLVVQGTNGEIEKGAIGWRVQPYSGVTSTNLHASIFYSPREIDDLATKDKGELAIGFVGSTNVNTGKPVEFLRKTNPGLSVKLNAEHDPADASKTRRLEAEPTSWDGFAETKGPKLTLPNSTSMNSWLKVIFDAVRTGPETYSITYRVEDWGANGTALVSVLMDSAAYTVENSNIANDPEIWAAFSLGPEKNGVAHLYLDQWETIAGENPPVVPVALSAVQVTSSSLLAKWQPGAGVYATGYVLDVSTAANNFAAGTLLSATGAGGQASGIVVSGSDTLQQRIENLLPGASYVYRVRGTNSYGSSISSNVIPTTTLANGQNSAPTLDPIVNSPALNINSSQQTVTLTGISAGGEADQLASVSATSSNPALVPNPFVDYSDPNETGTLQYTPTEGQTGTAIITVTVDDGEALNHLITRTFTITVTEPQTLISFNDASAMSRLNLTHFNGAGLAFGAASGIAGGGGAVFSKTGILESTTVAFRPTAYDATVSPWMRASIFINLREIVNLTSGKDKAELRFGFVGQNTPNASQPKDSINKTNPSLSLNFKVEHEFNKTDKDRKVSIELASFNGTTESKSSKQEALRVAATADWLQVNFYVVRGGQDQYYLVYDVQDWGVNGIAWQSQVFTGGPFLATNPAFFADNSVYAGFSLSTEATSTKPVYFDSYEVLVNTTAADAPLPLAASNVRAKQFTAEWAPPLVGLPPDGYVLDISTLANDFAPGTFINANGVGGQASGISINSISTTSRTITGLIPSENYLYRIRAKRGSELSAIIGKTYVTTLATDLVYWRETFFPGQLGNAAVSDLDADPEKDGVKNLLEYAVGMNPLSIDASGLPTIDINGDYLRMTYRRRYNAPDVVYTPQSCGNLADWQSNVTEIYASAPDANGLQTVIVEDNVPMDGASKRFLRLRVDLLP